LTNSNPKYTLVGTVFGLFARVLTLVSKQNKDPKIGRKLLEYGYNRPKAYVDAL
jgi:hypothetical protein